MEPIDYFLEISAKAAELFGPRCPEFSSFRIIISFDSPDGTPRTNLNLEKKEIQISLNNYTSNFTENHAFLDELAHETIHTLCPCARPEKTFKIEEGLGEYFTISFVHNRMHDDREARRQYHLEGIHRESLLLVEQIPNIEETVRKIREKSNCFSEMKINDLTDAGIPVSLASQLLEFAYPQ